MSVKSQLFISLLSKGSEKAMAPTPVLLPGKSNGQRSLEGCSPWGRWGSDTTERLHFHFSLSCIGEGNGNPLQCSCLENLRDRGAWWAAIYGVTQSRTRLKWLSSSNSSSSSSKGQALPPRQSMNVMPYVESVLSLPVTHGQADHRNIMGSGSRLSQ